MFKNWLVAGSNDGTVVIADLSVNNYESTRLRHKCSIIQVKALMGGGGFVLIGLDGVIKLFKFPNAKERRYVAKLYMCVFVTHSILPVPS